MTKFDFAFHDKKHFFWVIALTVKDILGVELHRFKDRKKGPEEVRVFV